MLEESSGDNSEESTEKPVKHTEKVLGEVKPLSDESIAEFNAKIKRTGVVCS